MEAAEVLSGRLPEFVRRLREQHGFLVGPGETESALRALQAVDLRREAEVRDALRAVLTGRREQGPVFDAAFRAFFHPAATAGTPPLPRLHAPPAPAARPAGNTAREGPPTRPGDDPDAEPSDAEAAGPVRPAGRPRPGDSLGDAIQAQTRRTLLSPNAAESGEAHVEGADLHELLGVAGRLVRAVPLGPSRRLRAQARGTRLEVRGTLRAAARMGGEATRLYWRGRPRRAPRFLVVLDGSRSMGEAAGRLLRFAQALALRGRVEVFVFSTGLHRLTPQLRRTPPGAPLRLPALGDAWGGGTRIGENLLRLTRDERARVTPDTLVLVLSDGLDTGDPALLVRALRDLKRRSAGVVWLSPLAGTAGYRPVQVAVQAAWPHLWAFLPAGHVADLHALPGRLREAALRGRGG